ncbi:MAG: hypothetical protein ACYTEK_15880 [Planctomycetota bacterium]
MRRRWGVVATQRLWRRQGNDGQCDVGMEYDTSVGDNHAHSELPFTIVICESELRIIAGISALSPNLEGGGESFGLQTRAGNPVVYLVSGPGSNSVRQAAYFCQDIDLFRRVSNTVSGSYGLQLDGTFHCHLALGICGPSTFDVEQARRIAIRNNLHQWCEIITSFADEGYGEALHNGRPGGAAWWQDCPRIRVRAFLYTNPQRGERTEVPLRVIPGVSPFRTAALASGKLAPDDIAEYASGFPMEKIIFDSYEPYKSSSIVKPTIFKKLDIQLRELPDEVQDGIKLDLEEDFALVTLPVSARKTVRVAYRNDQTDQVQAIFLFDSGTGQSHDVTSAVLHKSRNLTLKNIYESLRYRQTKAEHSWPFRDKQPFVPGRPANVSPGDMIHQTQLRRNTNG